VDAGRDPEKGLVLVAEDESSIADLERLYLTQAGYGVHVERDGRQALAQIRRLRPALVILDVGLPGIDGIEICRQLRAEDDWTPIVFVTARDDDVDRVLGLELGADDYVTKPFGVLELVARVEAVLRRASTSTTAKAPAPDASRFGDIEIQPVARVVRKNGRPVELSPKEYELLLALVQRPGQVISRAELLKTVWGYHASVVSRTIDTHIAELRRKLEPNPASPRHITTVWKTGYRFLP